MKLSQSFAIFFFIFNAFDAGEAGFAERHKLYKIVTSQSQYITVQEGDVVAYVARRDCGGGNVIVGKYIQEWNKIFVPYFGKEYEYTDGIEMMKSNGAHAWIPYPGHIPPNAIQGGQEGSIKLYVGRKWHEGKHLLGKIAEGINSLYCPYFGNELKIDDGFEILVDNAV